MIITTEKDLDEYLRDEGLEPDVIEDMEDEFWNRVKVEALRRRKP